MQETNLLTCKILVVVLVSMSALPTGAEEGSRLSNPLAATDKATLKGFVERPLFEPSRQTFAVAPFPVEAAPSSPIVWEQPPSLRLLGLVEGPLKPSAIVCRSDLEKTEPLHPGDRIGGWVVPATLRMTSGDRVYNHSLSHKIEPEASLPWGTIAARPAQTSRPLPPAGAM